MHLLSLFLVFAGLALFSSGEEYRLSSPDQRNEIRLTTGQNLCYSVYRDGKVRIAPTPISMTVEGRGVLGENPVVEGVQERKLDAVVKMPFYKKSEIRQNGNERVIRFKGGYQVILHARNDGVAYRFATRFDGQIKVLDEQASLTFPSPDLKGYVGYNHNTGKGPGQDKLQNSWESIYERMKVSEIAPDKSRLVYLPLLLEYEDGVSLVVTESDLLDYPGWNLYRKGDEPTRLSSWMARYPVSKAVVNDQRHRRVTRRESWLAETGGSRTFPWRVFILADQPVKLVESDIVAALASPCRIKGELDWIRPGLVAWEWWNNWNVTGVDFRAGCNTETYKYYIDFAARFGLDYLLMDEGWSVRLNVMKINPKVNLPEILRYAESKGVRVLLWCSWPQLVGRQHEIFKRYAALGVKGFKIDFMDRDDQFVVNFLEKTAAIAAEYKLIVDYHGMFKPTGMSRTYPNILNYEGVHGAEQLKWESRSDFPANNCKLAFTRMVAGPMDYTPGAMRNFTRRAFRPDYGMPGSQGTRCHQMALISLFEAPLQMLADSPSQYLQNQVCTAFMSKIPTVWDECVGLAGKVGEYAVLARRKGAVWYLSAITDWRPRTLKVDTSFLKGGEWRAEIFEDGVNADRDATDYRHRIKIFKAGETLTLKMMPGGGWTARVSCL